MWIAIELILVIVGRLIMAAFWLFAAIVASFFCLVMYLGVPVLAAVALYFFGAMVFSDATICQP